MKAMAHVSPPLVDTTTGAAALTIAEATTASTLLIHVLEDVLKERFVFLPPLLSPTDYTVLPLLLSVLEAVSHMITVVSPLVVPTALVPILILATAANVRVAISVKTAPRWTTVCQIPALQLTRLPVSTIQKAQGLFVSVPLAGEVTFAIRILTNAQVTQTSVTEAGVLINQGPTCVMTVLQTRLERTAAYV